MCSDVVIRVRDLSKCFHMYNQPSDRLKQMILPRFQQVAGLEKRQYFQVFWALKDLSMEVKRGETVGIIGKNGSGKSTLLQILCGTLSPTQGEVETTGRIAALLELGSGFNPEFTGRENVYMNASVLGLSKTEIDQRYDDIVDFADIGEFIDQPTKTYSSGMMVRLAFSVIAHVDADILIIDEALAVGDAFFTQKCMRFLRKFMETGTVLFVSHDTSAIRNLCNRAIWIDQGHMLMEGDPKSVSEAYLEAFFESQQGKSVVEKPSSVKPPVSRQRSDQRAEFINKSNLRNDLKVFEFSEDGSAFGSGKAKIVNVEFCNSAGEALSWIVGGENVSLNIEVEAYQSIESLIVGFYVKDRLGQELFGDNTYLSYIDNPFSCEKGQKVRASFAFQMPRLSSGFYSVTTAVASGSQSDHEQLHWVHDALTFRSESTSVVNGILGIPIEDVELRGVA